MTSISFARHQFPPDVIRHAVWLYLRFTLSLRDVEEMLAKRGLNLTYETVRRWSPSSARCLRGSCGSDGSDRPDAGTSTKWS